MRCLRQLRRFTWVRILPRVLPMTHTGARFLSFAARPNLRLSATGLFRAIQALFILNSCLRACSRFKISLSCKSVIL